MKNEILHTTIKFARESVLKFYRERLNTFYRGALFLLLVLCLVRLVFPSVTKGIGEPAPVDEVLVAEQTDSLNEEVALVADATEDVISVPDASEESSLVPNVPEESAPVPDVPEESHTVTGTIVANHKMVEMEGFYHDPNARSLNVQGKWHRVGHVSSYEKCFPDSQSVQLEAAQRWGVRPPKDRLEAESRKNELVYVGGSPYVHQDPSMSSSIPYLVPRASHLLNRIGRNFFDSLYVKGLPLHKIIVSSVLRSDADVARLSAVNGNVSKQSCHRYGTTFDICWTRFHPVQMPGGPAHQPVGDDVLKFVLSEVLRDLREEGVCYVKHEVKQTCFHITVR